MGVFDFLKPKPAVEKYGKQLREVYAQPDYRRTAMEKLFELDSDEGYRALLTRFRFNANGNIADESEKKDLVDRLIEVGEPALPAVQDFVRTEAAISYPIRALLEMMPSAEVTGFLKEALLSYEPLDHRSTQAKTNLIIALMELVPKEEVEVFVPYLNDHHDDVQHVAIEAMDKLGDEKISKALLELCVSEDHAPRIKRRAAQVLVDHQWSAKGYFERFDAELKEEYRLSKKGLLEKTAGDA